MGRFLLLDAIKREALDYWTLTGALDDAANEDPIFKSFLMLLRQSGFTDPIIGRFAQKVAAVTALQILHTLDQGRDHEHQAMPGWLLEETDRFGNPTGRDLGGLHESFQEFDPTCPVKE
jgi:hypothetical protein